LPEKITVMSKSATDTLTQVGAPWTQVNVFIPAHQTVDYNLTISYMSLFGDRAPDTAAVPKHPARRPHHSAEGRSEGEAVTT